MDNITSYGIYEFDVSHHPTNPVTSIQLMGPLRKINEMKKKNRKRSANVLLI